MGENPVFKVGGASVEVIVKDGFFESFGAISIGGAAVRNPKAPFRPWFDRYEGGVFNRFRFDGIAEEEGRTVVSLTAIGDDTYPFRERRDASGDVCFRARAFDAPKDEASLKIVFEPAEDSIDGHAFTGFSYHYEYDGGDGKIHRLADLATWELGGGIDGNTLVCRNWLTPPRVRLSRGEAYSTVGLDKWAQLLPGNLWGRWTLLPGFDFQYGRDGMLVGRFARVSLVRTVIETAAGEDALRVQDLHWFENSAKVSTNPKTILFCRDAVGDTEALNIWTGLQDADRDMARAQFGIPEEEPARLSLSKNVWHDFDFDTTYDDAIDVAAELGLDQVFIDVCWEQGESVRMALDAAVPPEKRAASALDKFVPRNMCCVYDLKVAREHGGEEALKRLCDKAAKRGVKIISWMAAHATPASALVEGDLAKKYGHGEFGTVAAMESGHHPSGGYPSSCWALNLNSPVYDYFHDSVLGVCRRTGLDGFLWDSYCNMGWWQVDYSAGTMKPQYDKMASMYADLVKEGRYVQPEAIVAFSSHSCCGLHGGDIYKGDQLGYSYDTMIGLWNTGVSVGDMMRGKTAVEAMFRCLAHRRSPGMDMADVPPRAEWDPHAIEALKEVFAMYRAARGSMAKRTVLDGDRGVAWTDKSGRSKIVWSFKEQEVPAGARDLATGETVATILPMRVYAVE